MGYDLIRPSFSSGELSPTLAARVDIAKYHTGARSLKNMFVHREGGISNRAGTEFIAFAKEGSKRAVLVPFEFSRTESYIIEAGDGYFRFFTDGSQIVTSTGEPYEISTYYGTEDLDHIRVAQSSDTMYIACKDKKPMRLIRFGQTAWEYNEYPFVKGPFLTEQSAENHLLVNIDQSILVSGGSSTYTNAGSFAFTVPANVYEINVVATGGGSCTYQGNFQGAPNKAAAQDSSFSWIVAAGAKWADKYGNPPLTKEVTVAVSNMQVSPGQVIGGYVGRGGEPMAGDGWSWGANGKVTISWPQKLSPQVTGYMSAKLNIFQSGHVGSVWKLRHYIPSQKSAYPDAVGIKCYGQWNVETSGYWAGTLRIERLNNITGQWELIRSMTSSKDRNYSDSGKVDEPTMIRIVGENFVAALPPGTTGDSYMYGKAVLETLPSTWDGIVKILSVRDAKYAKVEVQKEIGRNNTWTNEWFEGAWSSFNGYPSCVTFYQDRLVTGGTKGEPFGVFMSRPGDYNNYDISLPLEESDSIFRRILSRKNSRVNSISVLGDLLALTESGEFRISPSGDGAISPNNFEAISQSNIGSANINPVQIGNQLVYVQAGNSTIFDLGYSFEADGYTGSNLTILARHLFDNHKIVTMAYQRDPDSILWVVRDDGVLLGLTYMKEQEVIAWHRHETAGKFEWVEVIPHENGYDEVYLIVRRMIDGVERRCIERLMERINDNVEEAFFVDCGRTYRGNPTKFVYGLDHLKNKEVSILADGRVQKRQVVRPFTVDGAEVWGIELEKEFSTIHVGLPYESEMDPLSIEIAGSETLQAKKKLIPKVTVRVHKTLGGFVSAGDQGETEIKWNQFTTPIGEAEQPFTGDKEILPFDGYNKDGRVKILQRDPLPMTILAMIPELTMGGH